MIVIDKLCYQSNLRYVNAGEKFAFSVLTLLVCVISRSIVIAAIVLAVTGFLTVYKGQIPLFRYLRLLRLPLVFLFLSTLAIILNFSPDPMDAFAVSIGSIYITTSYANLRFALQLILTALASVSCLYFLSLSTPMTDILEVLKKIHCPAILIELMLLIYRFIFILLDIASAMSLSQKSRLGNRNFRTSCHSFGAIGGMLLIRALGKSNALYDAMEARCYDGTIRVLTESHPTRKQEIAWIVFFEIGLIFLAIFLRI
ncbi:MAG: cobalt ECF transporter T component CbiQ [Hespellia sp.]|nr:cobalt ECF transporter T component CbiQ [Hespellia sp.]